MSKIKSDNINYAADDFVVEISNENKNSQYEDISENELVLNRAEQEAQDIISDANKQAAQIVFQAKQEAQNKKDEILKEANEHAQEVLNNAQNEAQKLQEELAKQNQDLIENSKAQIEKERAQAAREGYEAGYEDAKKKLLEEVEEKIKSFDEFCSNSEIIREKILKSASRDIINLISNLSKVILFKELDAQSLDKIIKKTIALFEKKENITIIVSEKYAKMLFEFQNGLKEEDFNFENFKQYQNFDIVYNKQMPDDTIIIENPHERFDASVMVQLEKVLREIEEKTNSNLDLEEYIETDNEAEQSE